MLNKLQWTHFRILTILTVYKWNIKMSSLQHPVCLIYNCLMLLEKADMIYCTAIIICGYWSCLFKNLLRVYSSHWFPTQKMKPLKYIFIYRYFLVYTHFPNCSAKWVTRLLPSLANWLPNSPLQLQLVHWTNYLHPNLSLVWGKVI